MWKSKLYPGFALVNSFHFRLIIEREQKQKKSADFNRRFRDDVLDDDKPEDSYDFRKYGSYSAMTNWMRSLARQYPKILQFISIGKTHEGMVGNSFLDNNPLYFKEDQSRAWR
jgi:hypothetical protein